MNSKIKYFKILFSIVVILLYVIFSSSYIRSFISGEGHESQKEMILNPNMTIQEFIKANSLNDKFASNTFKVDKEKFSEKINNTGIKISEIEKNYTVFVEESKKNWFVIRMKFILWALFLGIVFYLIKNKKVTSRVRILLYFISFTLFGVILGSDPSSMGTVKDAIVLYGEKHIVFFPRIVAFTFFIITVVFANKFICSWGCQAGTLQDFFFRLNRDSNQRSIIPQFKIPFVISNSIRILFFSALIFFAFTKKTDIIDSIDIFKIFKYQFLSFYGFIFIIILLLSSLIIYRPWCTFLCPFGLISWLFEKISFNRIRVDHEKCISCGACEKACPSIIMSAILKNKKIIPDCFSCGSCIEACPKDAVSFGRKK